MSKTDKKLSEIFDLDPISTTIETVQTAELVTVEDDVVDSDTDYARKNIRNLIDKGNVAVDNLLQVSKESEQESKQIRCCFSLGKLEV